MHAVLKRCAVGPDSGAFFPRRNFPTIAHAASRSPLAKCSTACRGYSTPGPNGSCCRSAIRTAKPCIGALSSGVVTTGSLRRAITSGAASPALRIADDLPEAQTGTRSGQSQARRAALRAREAAYPASPAQEDSDCRSAAVHRKINAELGAPPRDFTAADRTGKAEPECVCGISERATTRRVPERALVYEHRACTHSDLDLAKGIQRQETEEVTGRNNPQPVRKAVDQEKAVTMPENSKALCY